MFVLGNRYGGSSCIYLNIGKKRVVSKSNSTLTILIQILARLRREWGVGSGASERHFYSSAAKINTQ